MNIRKVSAQPVESDRKYATILNIRVDSTSKEELLAKIGQKLALASKFYIVTPNPEIILQAQGDRRLAKILNEADLSIPDGIGLSQAARFSSLLAPRNMVIRTFVLFFRGMWVGAATFFNKKWLTDALSLHPGRETMVDLFHLADKLRSKVFLLGSTSKVINKCLERMRTEFPNAVVAGMAGPRLDKNGEPVSERDREVVKNTIDRINQFSPDFLFVAFGAPKQEKWLDKWLPKLKIGGAMVVGGALDYYAGVAQLPPSWMEKAGVEWLWRLINEPKRVGRIFRATVAFPLKVFLTNLTSR